ncbi:hypothetical protein [Okeania hirsuta]|nr:hypothetical protein [Okeania hirsuta]
MAEAEELLDSALQYYLEADLSSEVAITYNSLENLYKAKGEQPRQKNT